MRQIREILRLRWDLNLSIRSIAQSVRVAPSTVSDMLTRAEAGGLSWPLSDEFQDEVRLEALLYPEPQTGAPRPAPDMVWIQKELKKKGVTLQLLWKEYRERYPDGYQYSQFCSLYRAWEKTQEVSLRQEYKAGEKTFVDFAGLKMLVYDLETGEVVEADIFVGSLGASSLTYAEATRGQDQASWIGAHVRAFEFFDGTTEVLVPDNLKSGVTKSSLYEPSLNRTYQEMAAYYGCAIVPARARKPRDKAKVESAVQAVEREVLAPLRNRKFFSFDELNEAIRERLQALNSRPFQKRDDSRRSLYESLDKPALRPLPKEPYVLAQWKELRVHPDHHVQVDRAMYSVPYTLVGQMVEARVTSSVVEIFHRGQRVAIHPRSYTKGKFVSLPEHLPAAHTAYLEWNEERFTHWAQKTGAQTAALVKGLFEHKDHPEQAYRAAFGVLGLGRKYGTERLEMACGRAVMLRAFSYQSVRSILEKGLDAVPVTEPRTHESVTHENLRGPSYYSREGLDHAH